MPSWAAEGLQATVVLLDIQAHQSGELVGRARVAVRCGRQRTQFGEYFYRCHPVRRQFG